MEVMFYILWILGLIAALCVIIGIPYMLIYNYKRIRAIDKKLDGMLRGLSIILPATF